MMMRKLLISAIALGVLCACSGASAMTPPGTSTDICSTQAVPPFNLASPTAGSTGVSDSTSALLFTGTLYTAVGPPSIKLSTAAGATQTLTTFNSSSNGYSVPLSSALSPSTTYTVTYVAQLIANGTQTQCSYTASVDEGSFTTQ